MRKLVVRALLGDDAVFHEDDLVGGLECRQPVTNAKQMVSWCASRGRGYFLPMSDQDGRELLRLTDIGDGLVDQALARCIKRRGSPAHRGEIPSARARLKASGRGPKETKRTRRRPRFAASAGVRERSPSAVADPRKVARRVRRLGSQSRAAEFG